MFQILFASLLKQDGVEGLGFSICRQQFLQCKARKSRKCSICQQNEYCKIPQPEVYLFYIFFCMIVCNMYVRHVHFALEILSPVTLTSAIPLLLFLFFLQSHFSIFLRNEGKILGRKRNQTT